MEYVLRPPIDETWGGLRVRFEDDIRKCVVFLGVSVGDGSQVEYIGTGFFVEHEKFAHLVTARHVAEGLNLLPVVIGVNNRSGQAEPTPVEEIQWLYHRDTSVDVAVTLCVPPRHIDCIFWPTTHFATPETLENKNIGTGDEAYITGLFRVVTGRERFIPVVHTGHIAMLPAENIPVEGHPDGVSAYLVEAQSLDGLSGSPVFARRSVRVKERDDEDTGVPPLAYGALWLLGLWQASWLAPAESVFGPGQMEGAVIPAGMGVVVPAERILEVFDLPELKQMRERYERRQHEEDAATLD